MVLCCIYGHPIIIPTVLHTYMYLHSPVVIIDKILIIPSVQALPEDGVTVFAALPHTHLLGRQIRLRHFRDGAEVAPSIVRDDNYDFNYQQMRHVPPRRVLKGDQLTVECVYSSTDRETVTLVSSMGCGTRAVCCTARKVEGRCSLSSL